MRTVLENSKISGTALKSMETFHSENVKEVSQAVESNQYVIVGMKQNPVVKSAQKILIENNIPFKYIEYGSYFSKWRERLAIKLWSGWPTFPMVFIDGKLIGGCAELRTYMSNKKTN